MKVSSDEYYVRVRKMLASKRCAFTAFQVTLSVLFFKNPQLLEQTLPYT